MERHLIRMNWQTVKQLVPSEIDTVILPVGTIEAHGSACLGTDVFIPESIADAIVERINALIAPTVNHGVTKSLYRYSGSTTIKPETFQVYVGEVLDSLADSGFSNVIVMNGHGGNNTALKQVAFDFHEQWHRNIAVVHWWQLCGDMTTEFFGHTGGHAGTDETAMVQAIDDSLAGKEQYDPELAYYYQPGADVYPVPGTILLYKEGEGYPNYDGEQAKRYQQEVFKKVGDFVEMVLGRWKKFDL